MLYRLLGNVSGNRACRVQSHHRKRQSHFSWDHQLASNIYFWTIPIGATQAAMANFQLPQVRRLLAFQPLAGLLETGALAGPSGGLCQQSHSAIRQVPRQSANGQALRPQLFQLFKTFISPNICCLGHSLPHFPMIAPTDAPATPPLQLRLVIAVWPNELNDRIGSLATAPR